jgi:peptidoglycan/LPS O-acetylase OafA/YrhL
MLIALSFVLLFLTGYLLSRRQSLADGHAHAAVDGTRAYLGFAVFVSHFLLWRNYLASGVWHAESDVVYHLGTTSVAFFFVISAFLFFSKLASGRVDWLYLYIGRFLRITPLWFFVFVLTLLTLFATFRSLGGGTVLLPGQHQVKVSYSIITAGVSWSLWYEWCLYISLPLMSFLFFRQRARQDHMWCIASVAGLLGLAVIYRYSLANFTYFAIGALLALNEKNAWLRLPRLSRHFESGLLLLALCGLYALGREDVYLAYVMILLIFLFLVSGYDLWGLFSGSVSRFIAQQGYSLYLVQGPFIFLSFKLIGFSRIAMLSETEYLGLLCLLTPFFFVVCRFTYLCVEKLFWNKSVIQFFYSRLTNGWRWKN